MPRSHKIANYKVAIRFPAITANAKRSQRERKRDSLFRLFAHVDFSARHGPPALRMKLLSPWRWLSNRPRIARLDALCQPSSPSCGTTAPPRRWKAGSEEERWRKPLKSRSRLASTPLISCITGLIEEAARRIRNPYEAWVPPFSRVELFLSMYAVRRLVESCFHETQNAITVLARPSKFSSNQFLHDWRKE